LSIHGVGDEGAHVANLSIHGVGDEGAHVVNLSIHGVGDEGAHVANLSIHGVGDEGAHVVNYSNFVKKSKRENITPENIGEILLSQIPGISSHSAIEILKHFDGSFSKLITEIKTNPEKLNAIYLESSEGKRRKLSGSVIQSILKYLIA